MVFKPPIKMVNTKTLRVLPHAMYQTQFVYELLENYTDQQMAEGKLWPSLKDIDVYAA